MNDEEKLQIHQKQSRVLLIHCAGTVKHFYTIISMYYMQVLNATKPTKNRQMTPFSLPTEEFAFLFVCLFWSVMFNLESTLENRAQ